MILSFPTDTCRSGQTVQTQIRLLLEEQSDHGLHCLQLRLHHLDTLLYGKASLFNFSVTTANFSGVQIFSFTVINKQKQVAQRATIAHLSPMCQGQISFKTSMETSLSHYNSLEYFSNAQGPLIPQ